MAATRLGRWRSQDAPIGARPGAYITPIDDLARSVDERRAAPASTSKRPARTAQHIHIHMPGPAKTRDQPRARTHDATTPTGGFPVATGDTFTVGDCVADGFSLRRIRTGDVDKGGMPIPDNVYGQTDPPGAATNLDALRRRMAARPMHDHTMNTPQQQSDQLAAMQAYMNELHRPRS